MSEREVSEKEIDAKLELIMENYSNGTIKFLAKVLYNLRYDLNEMKLELLKVFAPEKPLDDNIPIDNEKDYGGFYA